MTDQIPRTTDLLTAAIDGLVGDLTGDAAQRRYYKANHGWYGAVLKGFVAQAALVRRRLVEEVNARRLGLARGTALRELVESEGRVTLVDGAQAAVGEVSLRRQVTNASAGQTGNFTAGVIAKGHRIRSPSAQLYPVALSEMTYEVSEDFVCTTNDTEAPVAGSEPGEWVHTQIVTVPIRATLDGEAGNIPVVNGFTAPTPAIVGPMFDTFTPYAASGNALFAAGGTSGLVDEKIEAIGRAVATGFQGPNIDAAVAGALLVPGVRRATGWNDPLYAVMRLIIGDSSWATSARFRADTVEQLQKGKSIGFGLVVEGMPLVNEPIGVDVNVVLRDAKFLAQQVEITEVIRDACQTYFDDRPDWWIWRTSALGAELSRADSRILACTGVVVRSLPGGGVLSEPPIPTGSSPNRTHYLVVSRGVNAAFEVA